MQNYRRTLLIVAITLFFGVFIFSCTGNLTSTYDDIFDRETVFVKGFTKTFTYFRESINKIKAAETPEDVTKAANDSLTFYLSPEELLLTTSVHIGIFVDSSCVISHIVNNSSANESCLSVGDTIKAINEIETTDYKSTQENLNGFQGESKIVAFKHNDSLLIDTIIIKSFTPAVAEIIDCERYKAFLIRKFDPSITEDINLAIDSTKFQNILFDIRGCRGGDIETAVEIASHCSNVNDSLRVNYWNKNAETFQDTMLRFSSDNQKFDTITIVTDTLTMGTAVLFTRFIKSGSQKTIILGNTLNEPKTIQAVSSTPLNGTIYVTNGVITSSLSNISPDISIDKICNNVLIKNLSLLDNIRILTNTENSPSVSSIWLNKF